MLIFILQIILSFTILYTYVYIYVTINKMNYGSTPPQDTYETGSLYFDLSATFAPIVHITCLIFIFLLKSRMFYGCKTSS